MNETEETIVVYRVTYDGSDSHLECRTVLKEHGFQHNQQYGDFYCFTEGRKALLDHLSYYNRKYKRALLKARALRKDDV